MQRSVQKTKKLTMEQERQLRKHLETKIGEQIAYLIRHDGTIEFVKQQAQ